MHIAPLRSPFAWAAALLLVGCGNTSSSNEPDAGADAAFAETSAVDAGADVADDGATDASTDSKSDDATDASDVGSDTATTLGCPSSAPLGAAVPISPSISASFGNALSLGVAGSVGAVGWIDTQPGGNTTPSYLQLIDLPTVGKHGDLITLASAALEEGGPIRIAPSGSDFLLAYDRTDYTYGTVRTRLEKIDAAGTRSLFQFDAQTPAPTALITTPAGSAIAYGDFDVSLRRFTTAGAFAPGTSVTSISTHGVRAGLAYDDASSTYLLLYRHYVSGDPFPTPAVARVASNGALMSADTPVAPGAFIGTQSPFRLVATKSGYSTVFDRNDASGKSLGLHLLSLHADGSADGAPKLLVTTGHEAALAWNGSFFGVIWEDARDTVGGSIYFAAFDASGTRLGDELQLSPPIDRGRYVDIAWDGKAFVVVWMDQRESIGQQRVYATRVCGAS